MQVDQAADFAHLLWLLPTAICSYGVKFLRDLSLSVNELNKTLSVMVTRVDAHEDKIDDHEQRLRDVERPAHGEVG